MAIILDRYHWWMGNEMWYIYTVGSYSVVKNLNLWHVRKWEELGNTQSKVTQAQRDKQHTFSLTCGSSLLILCVCIWLKCVQNPKDSKGPMREEESLWEEEILGEEGQQNRCAIKQSWRGGEMRQRQERRGWWETPTKNNEILKKKSMWKSDTSQDNKKIKSAG